MSLKTGELSAEPSSRLIAGDLVEVRPARDILATLDPNHKLDGVPFMPEMAALCGRRFRVVRRADMTCVEGLGMRQLDSTVFLDHARCDGSAHDGCERRCRFFWKESWLKPVAEGPAGPAATPDAEEIAALEALRRAPTRDGARFLCQSTELAAATPELSGWNPGPLLRQMRDRELTPVRFLSIVAHALANRLRRALGLGAIGQLAGARSASGAGPADLAVGDWVKIRPRADIAGTLDVRGCNRGLLFEPEMSDYAGRRARVAFPVRRIINEQTGEMTEIARTVALDGLICKGLAAKGCPRGNYWFWRTDWLDPDISGSDASRLADRRIPVAEETLRQMILTELAAASYRGVLGVVIARTTPSAAEAGDWKVLTINPGRERDTGALFRTLEAVVARLQLRYALIR
jgi:hypothetical protein